MGASNQNKKDLIQLADRERQLIKMLFFLILIHINERKKIDVMQTPKES